MSRPTPETDAEFDGINAFCKEDRKLNAMTSHARKLERERDDYKWQLHIAKGEIAEARKMERAWKKEETK